MSKTFDLSTLGLSAGTYEITVKARASGYLDSAPSNAVSYIVAVGQPTQGLAYRLSDDGTYYICTGIGTATDTDIVIASEIDGIPVTRVIGYCFHDTTIESVVIPDGVTIIEENTFRNCGNLKKVVIPNSVTKIDNEAFYECTSLNEIVIPDKVEYIGYEAFYKCTSLNEIVIPSWVAWLGANAFLNCNNLTIYCEVQRSPSYWDSKWNYSNCPVVWGNRALISFNVTNLEKEVLNGTTWGDIEHAVWWGITVDIVDGVVYYDYLENRRLLYLGNIVYATDLIIENGVYTAEDPQNNGGSN